MQHIAGVPSLIGELLAGHAWLCADAGELTAG
jgi:hypothetical protein